MPLPLTLKGRARTQTAKAQPFAFSIDDLGRAGAKAVDQLGRDSSRAVDKWMRAVTQPGPPPSAAPAAPRQYTRPPEKQVMIGKGYASPRPRGFDQARDVSDVVSGAYGKLVSDYQQAQDRRLAMARRPFVEQIMQAPKILAEGTRDDLNTVANLAGLAFSPVVGAWHATVRPVAEPVSDFLYDHGLPAYAEPDYADLLKGRLPQPRKLSQAESRLALEGMLTTSASMALPAKAGPPRPGSLPFWGGARGRNLQARPPQFQGADKIAADIAPDLGRGGEDVLQWGANPFVTPARSQFAGMPLAERRTLLEGKLEANAMRRLVELEDAVQGAHFVERHGPQTTLASQYDRAAFGINPTTRLQSYPTTATRYFNARDPLSAITRAEQIYMNTGSHDLARAPIKFGRLIGEGYEAGTLNYGQQTQAIVRLDPQGRAYTTFPRYGY